MSQTRRPSNQNRPTVNRPGSTGLRFGMFAVCVVRDSDPGLNSGKGKPLYDLLVSYADVSSRDTGQGYPYREALASCLDCSKQTVDRAADYLEKEIGLVTIHRRKVEGKPDENDANLYEIHDAWLIHGVTPPAGTPPQLVARYGHTVPGLDVDAWIGEHAPSFDLAAWRAAYAAKLRVQAAKREEQRRKERARRRKSKKGGDVTDDATPEGGESEGGGVMGDARGGVTHDVSGGVMGDALSRTGFSDPAARDDTPFGGVAPGGSRRASTSGSSGDGESGCAASAKSSPAPRSGEPKSSSKGSGPKLGARLTAEERETRDAVLQLLPSELRETLGHVIPASVVRGIVETMATGTPRSRAPQQLVTYRLLPRWQRYWAGKFFAGELTPVVNGKKRRPFGPLLEMLKDTPECGNPFCEDRYDFVADRDCTQCEMRKVDRNADRARQRQASEVADEPLADVPAPRLAEGFLLPRECPCGDPISKTAEDPLCGQCRKDADEAEETARIRAQLAAQFGTPDEVEAYSRTAPF